MRGSVGVQSRSMQQMRRRLIRPLPSHSNSVRSLVYAYPSSIMRVIHFTPSAISFRNQLDRRLQLLSEHGIENIGVSTDIGLETEDFQRPHLEFVRSRHLTRHWTPLADLYYCAECIQLIRRYAPACVISYGSKPSVFVRIAAFVCRVPVKIHVSWGLYFTEQSSIFYKSAICAIDYCCSLLSDVVYSQSRSDWQLMQRYPLQSSEKFRLQGQGVDIATRYNSSTYRDHLQVIRSMFDLPAGVFRFFIAARLVTFKGYPELVAAIKRLAADSSVPFELIVCGASDQPKDAIPGDLLPDIGHRRDHILYLGAVKPDIIPKLLAVVDCYVLPSHREGFSRSIVEAMAMGLPVVTTSARGCGEAIEHGYNGIIVPVQDEDALYHALKKILEAPDLARRYGTHSRTLALSRYSEDRIVDEMVAVMCNNTT